MAVARLLLSFAVALQLLNLLLLILDLPLLIVDLRLGLSLLILPILHLVADCISAQRADTAADCRACERIPNRSADNRARRRADAGSDEGAFLTSREGFSRASHRHHERNRHEQAFNQRQGNRICPHGLSPSKGSSFHACRRLRTFLSREAGWFIEPPIVFYLIRGQSTIWAKKSCVEIFTDFPSRCDARINEY
jgi:hypothetical protein